MKSRIAVLTSYAAALHWIGRWDTEKTIMNEYAKITIWDCVLFISRVLLSITTHLIYSQIILNINYKFTNLSAKQPREKPFLFPYYICRVRGGRNGGFITFARFFDSFKVSLKLNHFLSLLRSLIYFLLLSTLYSSTLDCRCECLYFLICHGIIIPRSGRSRCGLKHRRSRATLIAPATIERHALVWSK